MVSKIHRMLEEMVPENKINPQMAEQLFNEIDTFLNMPNDVMTMSMLSSVVGNINKLTAYFIANTGEEYFFSLEQFKLMAAKVMDIAAKFRTEMRTIYEESLKQESQYAALEIGIKGNLNYLSLKAQAEELASINSQEA